MHSKESKLTLKTHGGALGRSQVKSDIQDRIENLEKILWGRDWEGRYNNLEEKCWMMTVFKVDGWISALLIMFPPRNPGWFSVLRDPLHGHRVSRGLSL